MSVQFLSSRKFWAAVAAVLVTLLVELVPALSQLEESLTEIITIIGIYILSTGLADFGKNAAN